MQQVMLGQRFGGSVTIDNALVHRLPVGYPSQKSRWTDALSACQAFALRVAHRRLVKLGRGSEGVHFSSCMRR